MLLHELAFVGDFDIRLFLKSVMLPERYMSTFILSESISMLMNLKLYFGMSSVSLIFFRVVVSIKLSILSFSTGRYFYVAGVTLTFAIMFTLPSSIVV